MRFESLIGRRFGRLVVRALAEGRQNGKRIWLCECDCGQEKRIVGGNLTSGASQSCGCVMVQKSRERILRQSLKHGHAAGKHTSEYRSWAAMLKRCRQPTCNYYHRYGGRGIRVCDRWRDFSKFLTDMGHKPTPQHSIDRIDGDGNYEPSNCRWATASEQRRNQHRMVK